MERIQKDVISNGERGMWDDYSQKDEQDKKNTAGKRT